MVSVKRCILPVFVFEPFDQGFSVALAFWTRIQRLHQSVQNDVRRWVLAFALLSEGGFDRLPVQFQKLQHLVETSVVFDNATFGHFNDELLRSVDFTAVTRETNFVVLSPVVAYTVVLVEVEPYGLVFRSVGPLQATQVELSCLLFARRFVLDLCWLEAFLSRPDLKQGRAVCHLLKAKYAVVLLLLSGNRVSFALPEKSR